MLLSPLPAPTVFENKDKIVIIMEYASKGELYDYISERRRLSERETRHFFRQIVSAVHYCHKVRSLAVVSCGAMGFLLFDSHREGDVSSL